MIARFASGEEPAGVRLELDYSELAALMRGEVVVDVLATGERVTVLADLLPDTPIDPDELARWRSSTPRELGLEIAGVVEAMAQARDFDTERREIRGTIRRASEHG